MSDIKVLHDAIKYYHYNLNIHLRNVDEILKIVLNVSRISDLFIQKSWFFNTSKPEILKYITISKLIEIINAYEEHIEKADNLDLISTVINIRAILISCSNYLKV